MVPVPYYPGMILVSIITLCIIFREEITLRIDFRQVFRETLMIIFLPVILLYCVIINCIPFHKKPQDKN